MKRRNFEEKELNITPFMNLLVVLVPMLLVSAEFAKISIIDLKLPEGRGSQTEKAVKQRPKEEDNKLLLTVIITDSVLTLGAKGGFLPSLFYQEFHKYIPKEGGEPVTVKFDPKKPEPPTNAKTGNQFTIHERQEILLYACDDEYKELHKVLYNSYGEMITDVEGRAITEVSVGDSVYALSNPRRLIIVKDKSEFELKPISVYDELKNRLMKVKDRFQDAEDVDDVIIAAENQVMYDKIVQIMDSAREADFPNISIAKLRG